MHGKGTLLYSNGNKYEGNFIDDLKHGEGIFIWSNNDRYEGDFKNN